MAIALCFNAPGPSILVCSECECGVFALRIPRGDSLPEREKEILVFVGTYSVLIEPLPPSVYSQKSNTAHFTFRKVYKRLARFVF